MIDNKNILLKGKREEEKKEEQDLNTYHLNYLLYSAYKTSNDTSRLVTIYNIYKEYNDACPNPLCFSLFVNIFRTCMLSGYFDGTKSDIPMLIDHFHVNMTHSQYELIDKQIYGDEDVENEVL